MAKAVRNVGRPGTVGYAISAVDVALWDLKARLLGLPLHRLLGAVRDEVPVYGSGGFTTYDEDQLRASSRLGPRPAHPPGEDQDRRILGQPRSPATSNGWRRRGTTIGADAELFVDANGGYDRKQAIRVMPAAADSTSAGSRNRSPPTIWTGCARSATLYADVAAGEYGYDLTYFRRMCAAGAVDCLQADVSRCGGITEWLRVAAVAAAYDLEISGHCAPHLHAHAAAATPNLRHLEWFHDHVRIEHMFFDGALDPTGGALLRIPRRRATGCACGARSPRATISAPPPPATNGTRREGEVSGMSGPAEQVVVVTGASGGIGRAVARAFGARGAKVGCWPAGRSAWTARPRTSRPQAGPRW